MPASPIFELRPPLAIVCHDAGAANLVFAWMVRALAVQSSVADPWRLVLAGPAERIWSALGETRVARCDTIEQALEGAATLLSGTGWASDLEHRARARAAALGVKSIAVIDHWVNYADRFEREGERVLPDVIWVADDYAFDIAVSTFPGRDVRALPNLYLERQLALISPPPAGPPTLLYLAEPTRNKWGRGTPGEFQALDFLVAGLPRLDVPDGTLLLLRLHPSEPTGKYDAWIAANAGLDVEIDRSADVAEAVSRAQWVAGIESQALVVALAAGRRVVCAMPPWAPPCRLPHSGLIHLKDLAAQP